jgi:hypothetical protein
VYERTLPSVVARHRYTQQIRNQGLGESLPTLNTCPHEACALADIAVSYSSHYDVSEERGRLILSRADREMVGRFYSQEPGPIKQDLSVPAGRS